MIIKKLRIIMSPITENISLYITSYCCNVSIKFEQMLEPKDEIFRNFLIFILLKYKSFELELDAEEFFNEFEDYVNHIIYYLRHRRLIEKIITHQLLTKVFSIISVYLNYDFFEDSKKIRERYLNLLIRVFKITMNFYRYLAYLVHWLLFRPIAIKISHYVIFYVKSKYFIIDSNIKNNIKFIWPTDNNVELEDLFNTDFDKLINSLKVFESDGRLERKILTLLNFMYSKGV